MTYISHTSGEPAKRSNYTIVFDGRKQLATNRWGLPNLKTVHPFRAEDVEVVHTRAEDVYCHAPGGNAGLLYQCGLSFLHRGARWQLYFDWQHRNKGLAIKRKAIAALETFRRKQAG